MFQSLSRPTFPIPAPFAHVYRLVRRTAAEAGQTMVETALILLLVSIAAVAAVVLIGPAVSSVFEEVAATW